MKTSDKTQAWARQVASYVLWFVAFFMALVSITIPFLAPLIKGFWFQLPHFYYLSLIPLTTLLLMIVVWKDLTTARGEVRPFLATIGIFSTGYLGLALSIYPWIIPFKATLWEAAAEGPGLSLMLVGIVPLLPIILGYTAYCYYIFRGKSEHDSLY